MQFDSRLGILYFEIRMFLLYHLYNVLSTFCEMAVAYNINKKFCWIEVMTDTLTLPKYCLSVITYSSQSLSD